MSIKYDKALAHTVCVTLGYVGPPANRLNFNPPTSQYIFIRSFSQFISNSSCSCIIIKATMGQRWPILGQSRFQFRFRLQ